MLKNIRELQWASEMILAAEIILKKFQLWLHVK